MRKTDLTRPQGLSQSFFKRPRRAAREAKRVAYAITNSEEGLANRESAGDTGTLKTHARIAIVAADSG